MILHYYYYMRSDVDDPYPAFISALIRRVHTRHSIYIYIRGSRSLTHSCSLSLVFVSVWHPAKLDGIDIFLIDAAQRENKKKRKAFVACSQQLIKRSGHVHG